MLDQYEDKSARNIIVGLIAGGGLLGFLGLTLPYLIIYNVSGSGVSLIFDAFSLSYYESIPQAIGNLLAITTAISLFSYGKSIPKEKEKASKKLERNIFFVVSSIICILIGLIFTFYDIIDSVLSAIEASSGESIGLGIGFYFSLAGTVLAIIGVYNLIKLRKRLFLP
ncbi:MAG: hypothetical protein ACW98F_19080 [Candidatus Hodarchaeales archaeon]|jgi:hypothetical protein